MSVWNHFIRITLVLSFDTVWSNLVLKWSTLLLRWWTYFGSASSNYLGIKLKHLIHLCLLNISTLHATGTVLASWLNGCATCTLGGRSAVCWTQGSSLMLRAWDRHLQMQISYCSLMMTWCALISSWHCTLEALWIRSIPDQKYTHACSRLLLYGGNFWHVTFWVHAVPSCIQLPSWCHSKLQVGS